MCWETINVPFSFEGPQRSLEDRAMIVNVISMLSPVWHPAWKVRRVWFLRVTGFINKKLGINLYRILLYIGLLSIHLSSLYERPALALTVHCVLISRIGWRSRFCEPCSLAIVHSAFASKYFVNLLFANCLFLIPIVWQTSHNIRSFASYLFGIIR